MLRVGGRDAGAARKWVFRRFDLPAGEKEEGEKRGKRKMGCDLCVCVCVCVCANERETERDRVNDWRERVRTVSQAGSETERETMSGRAREIEESICTHNNQH